MWAILLLQLFTLAWHQAAAAPVADPGLVEAMLWKRDGSCPTPNAQSTVYKFFFTGTYKCDGGTYSSGKTYTRFSQEFVTVNEGTGTFTDFRACVNIEKYFYYGGATQFVAEHYWGPVEVDDIFGKRECCYTLKHQFDIVFDQAKKKPVPSFNSGGTQMLEGCSQPEDMICPAQSAQSECAPTVDEDPNICPWTGTIPDSCVAKSPG
ncbi:uncharacterized protein BKA78DRAFT_349763 [Phyllosticta capitalensis]|uniref:uncharacterized protein n=1 Tax=Phyllosticta capitalensis TaxID=121624 RepID=UPI0031325036